MYVVIKVRVEDGRVQYVGSFRQTVEGEVLDAATDAMATDVAVVAEMAVSGMMRTERRP